jgi:hypothetical protein
MCTVPPLYWVFTSVGPAAVWIAVLKWIKAHDRGLKPSGDITAIMRITKLTEFHLTVNMTTIQIFVFVSRGTSTCI